MSEPTPNAATLEQIKVPRRVMIMNSIQLLGLMAAALAVPSPELAAALAILPDPIVGNIGKVALILLALKPVVNIAGDLYDNGKLDKSWKEN